MSEKEENKNIKKENKKVSSDEIDLTIEDLSVEKEVDINIDFDLEEVDMPETLDDSTDSSNNSDDVNNNDNSYDLNNTDGSSNEMGGVNSNSLDSEENLNNSKSPESEDILDDDKNPDKKDEGQKKEESKDEEKPKTPTENSDKPQDSTPNGNIPENKDGQEDTKKDDLNKSPDNNPNNQASSQENKSSNKEQQNSSNQNPNQPTSNTEQQKNDNTPNNQSSAQQKRNEAKNKQENRNRNNRQNKPDQNASSKPKSGGNFKDRVKNNIKNKASSAVNNSKPVQKVKDAKEKVQKVKKAGTAIKAIVSFIGPVGFGIIFLVLIAALLITMFFIYSPGSKGSIEDANSRYSEADQKAIEKLKVLYDKYPNADSSLAMLTTLYPYFPELWGADVLANLEWASDPNNTEEDAPEEGDDLENIESDDTVQDDVYLSYFHKSKYRNKIKKLLRKMHNDGEDAYYEYLKNDYFNGNGYDELFDLASDKEKLKELIIEDLKNNKDLFANYVYDNAVCASTLISAGQMDTADLLKGNVLVDLKMPGCSSMKNCSESYYDTYLTLEEYVKGVVYEEIADNTDVNQIAAQMVAAKTYTLSRREGSIKQDASTGAYVIPMLWSTADQDFCHTELGCNSDDIKAHYGYETGGDSRLMHGRNREPATEKQKALYEEAWELSKDVYVVDKDGTAASVGYYVGSGCKVGKCMDQSKLPNYAGVEYKSILSTFYTSYSLATVEGDKSNIEVRGTQVCTNASTNYTATRAKIAAFALDQVGKVPYYEGGLAVVSDFDGNDFGTDTTDDGLGNTKKGLGAVGFVNWVYWSVIDDNLGNTNDLDTIISQGFEVASDKLLIGDIGYSSDKTVVGIYAGDNKWVMEDAVTGNVVAKPDDRITLFVRHISFKNERYNYTIRQSKPTVTEWGRINSVDNLENALWPSSDFYIGECIWYVKFRSLEIINELKNNGSLTEKQYDNLYKKLKQKAGTAIEYSPNNSKGPAKYYSNSMNINDIRPGSFLVTTSSTSSAGHISAVESFDGQNITITDGWNGEGKNANNTCTKSNFDCFTFRTRTFTYDEYINTFSSSFRGYLYFLED